LDMKIDFFTKVFDGIFIKFGIDYSVSKSSNNLVVLLKISEI